MTDAKRDEVLGAQARRCARRRNLLALNLAFVTIMEELLRQLAAGAPAGTVLPLVSNAWNTYRAANARDVASYLRSEECTYHTDHLRNLAERPEAATDGSWSDEDEEDYGFSDEEEFSDDE